MQHFERLAASPDPHAAAVARTVARAFLFPVDSMILSPRGEILAHACYNDFPRDDVPFYHQLLDAATRPR